MCFCPWNKLLSTFSAASGERVCCLLSLGCSQWTLSGRWVAESSRKFVDLPQKLKFSLHLYSSKVIFDTWSIFLTKVYYFNFFTIMSDTYTWYKSIIKLCKYKYKHKITSYPAIHFKKLRICCIANFWSIYNIFFPHIKCRGKACYTSITSVPIIRIQKINI